MLTIWLRRDITTFYVGTLKEEIKVVDAFNTLFDNTGGVLLNKTINTYSDSLWASDFGRFPFQESTKRGTLPASGLVIWWQRIFQKKKKGAITTKKEKAVISKTQKIKNVA